MSRRGRYLKHDMFKVESLNVNFFGLVNGNGNADIVSSEVIDFAAKLFFLAAKRGPVKKNDTEVFDEAI